MKHLISANLFIAGLLAASLSHASVLIDNSTVQILGTSSAPYPAYPQSDAIDTGANRYSTDFAGNGTGTGTHLDFDFGAATTFTQIAYTDRTSSGGANGSNSFGRSDYVTSYEYIFSDNADFSAPIGSFTFVTPLLTTAPLTLQDFQHIDAIPSITARYVEWQVVSANGANPGAADFAFSAVPEPAPLALLGLGLLGFIASRRKSKN